MTIAKISVAGSLTLGSFRELLTTVPLAIGGTNEGILTRERSIPTFRVRVPNEEGDDFLSEYRKDSDKKWNLVIDRGEPFMQLHDSLTFLECKPFADPQLWLYLCF
jgi:hypothetical protein